MLSRPSRFPGFLACAFLGLALLLAHAIAAGAVEPRWPDERIAGSFVFHADHSLSKHRDLLNELSGLQRDLIQTLNSGRTRTPIHLFLFAKRSTYETYMNTYFPEVPFRRALYVKYDDNGLVFAYQSDDFDVDVRHESTHALLHSDLPMVPLWLDEGLAEYFEMSPDQRAFGSPHLKMTKWSAWLGLVPEIEDLEEIESLNEMGAREYRGAWAWTHFMLHGSKQAHTELVRYLADIRAHKPPGALSERLRRGIPDLERRFTEHFRSWKR
ncbi:MAG: hypothetical protein ACQESR_21975 [Planctomycetota bacterium]